MDATDIAGFMFLSKSFNILAAYKKKKRRHRYWVRDMYRRRQEHGVFHHLVMELEMDDANFKEYFRLNKHQFGIVLSHIEAEMTKYSPCRAVICAKQRLAICLRFLATGESYHSLAFQYRVGVMTVCKIVREVSRAIWANMANVYLRVPSTPEEWRLIAKDFEQKWQFPNCLGSLDGKHIRIQAPNNSGSLYFNYKGYSSIVLLAVVDANYRFQCIDIGAYGRNSDAGIFSSSNLGRAVGANTLNFPPDEPLPGRNEPVPYVMVADEAFPLQRHLLRPFPGSNCTLNQREFNYRLSRARRMVESTFGILANRFRIFRTAICVQPEIVNDIVKATCILHNLIQPETNISEPEQDEIYAMQPLQRTGHHGAENALSVRNTFMDYFVNEGRLDYQLNIVQRGTLD